MEEMTKEKKTGVNGKSKTPVKVDYKYFKDTWC